MGYKDMQTLVETLPAELQQNTLFSLQQLQQQLTDLEICLPVQQALHDTIAMVFASSEFISKSCIHKPDILLDLCDTGDLFKAYPHNYYQSFLESQTPTSEPDLMALLRRFRNREMIRIAWRDLAGWSGLDETLTELSLLAESCIQFALDYLYQQACAQRGTPRLKDGSAQQLIVLGMGKLGAYELNFSSDIDLIFAYAEDGVLEDRKATTYGEFFSRLCRSLVKVLDEVTVDGFVFRTDIRLRPFGDSGPVVMNFIGMEQYYLTQAREWERYAMIKARQVAGDQVTGPQLMAMLHPFIYRRYLDYGAFEELRSLKFQINEELHRKDHLQNIKLGPGGIREIEFIGQAYQLIRGGQETVLQQRSIVKTINSLAELQWLSPETSEQLLESYVFLRRVENHIQAYQDQQKHDLPNDVAEQASLCFSMGFEDWSSFVNHLQKIRLAVQVVFDQVFSMEGQQEISQEALSIWVGEADESNLISYLSHLGFEDPDQILSDLHNFKQAKALKKLSAKGAAVLDKLIPKILQALPEINQPETTFTRILGLLEAVVGRNVYLSLLSENPDALHQLLTLSSASSWICQYLSLYPVLFDELLDTRSLYAPLEPAALQHKLSAFLKRNPSGDEEQLMFALRKFKQINVLSVAAADIMETIPVTVVSDYLTYIAEVILQQVVQHAWALITKKYGTPDDKTEPMAGFGVLGFGKLGGIELGYGSDLDMVFLYECKDGNALTNGKKAIGCTQFYIRLAQKIMHLLQTKLLSGMLYEADMRLRPSGNSGLLVTHVSAYEGYFRKEAWTWEHQALVRARFVAGDPEIKTSFDKIRHTILCLPRPVDTLKTEVREMREKMRDNLAVKDNTKFDLKQSKGGIADIEFIVQFNVLARAAEQPLLTAHTDNIHSLESLQQYGYLTSTTASTLKDAYISYRNRGHKEALQGNKNIIPADEYAQMRSQVVAIWDQFME